MIRRIALVLIALLMLVWRAQAQPLVGGVTVASQQTQNAVDGVSCEPFTQ